ncbi:MAG: DUF4163 domain-containing protein, partial [Clostridiales bacterium]|nr:DUF4163 domain-containing protein [Clostridiales bacterium]
MKKKFKSALIALGIALMCGNVVFAKSATVYVDENEIKIPQKCIVEGDHLLMPLRSICENLGYEVFWDEEARQVRIKRDFRDILYTIDSSNMVVNNIKKKTEIKPRLVKDRTYVSLESLAEALGENVQWQKENGLVGIELDYGYENGNWQEIFDLEKSYEKKDDNGDVLYSIHVSVPQLANYKNDAALEKINEYYRNKANSEFNDYAKLAEDDMTMRIDKEGISYASGYRVMQNFRNILSIYRVRINKQQSPIVEADVFNVETGEKLTVYDILKGSKKDIDQMIVNLIKDGLKKTPIMVDDKPITYNGGLENVDFAMQGGDLVFFLNPIGDILHFRLKLQENKEMFNINASDKFNYAEEKLARKVAMDSCNEYVKLIEKTTLGTDECYVYEKYNDDTKERIAIDRSLEKIYKLKKKNGMYFASSKRRIKDEISDRDAVKLVRNRIDSNEYATSVYGNMKNSDDGQEYSIINVRNLDGTVDRKLAVSRKDGAIYIEKKKVTPKLEQKDDGTISAVGFLEIDPELTNR